MIAAPSPAIVLVDDEPAVLTLLQRLVCPLALGYDVIAAADGATALAEIAQRPVVLLITDDHMPGMDGLAVITAVKVVAPQCPVVLISGNLTPELIERGRAAGVDFYLPKPFPCDQFTAVVQMVLAHEAAVGEALYG